MAQVETQLQTVDVFDVTFAGYGGHPVRAWLRLPRQRAGQLPGIVQFHGYASGRGHPLDDLLWASAGFAHLLMDTRGQGGDYAGGATGDPAGSGPSHPGFLTRGIEDRDTYYYRRVFVDAVRAVQVLQHHEDVNPTSVAAVGASQGGGIALAVAGLVPELAGLFAQAPFLDGIGFARRATAPAWFSTGLMDEACPPSTAFGAYHAYAGPKQIRLWEYNGHEAGGAEDLAVVLSAFRALLPEPQ
jgi:cephalosporin-C deacetylase